MRASFMIEEDGDYDGDDEPQELPEVLTDEPGPCTTCGKPEQRHACFSCGQPVCMDETNYLADTPCGGWILDTWHPAHPDENEYYCQRCLRAGMAASA